MILFISSEMIYKPPYKVCRNKLIVEVGSNISMKEQQRAKYNEHKNIIYYYYFTMWYICSI